ncbi:unnamed protein product [Brassicogethes aeneus]|uniref:Uncharacterized protein n=1 Tax=Brassicogethes aeneus TaxID=1431903 RepID=A0A9P0BE47_BRAAE|nr:unnamed protein product [Brassicogethes aeneus]
MQQSSQDETETSTKPKFNENLKSAFKHVGGVAANSELSVAVGIDILEQGGSAADSAIATLLMDGICNPQSMGLGGGFLCTHYQQNSATVECLNAREYAPIRAKGDLFDNLFPIVGGLSVCVPGELQGYWDLHQKYGKLEWGKVLEPAIFYCKNGIPISKYCGSFIESRRSQIMESPTLKYYTHRVTTSMVQENKKHVSKRQRRTYRTR